MALLNDPFVTTPPVAHAPSGVSAAFDVTPAASSTAPATNGEFDTSMPENMTLYPVTPILAPKAGGGVLLTFPADAKLPDTAKIEFLLYLAPIDWRIISSRSIQANVGYNNAPQLTDVAGLYTSAKCRVRNGTTVSAWSNAAGLHT